MRIFLTTIACALIVSTLTISLAGVARAETGAVQKAFESVKGTLDSLVGAKDEKSESLELRIKALQRVVELSETEAKDLKLQLLALEGIEPKTIVWRDATFEKLNTILAYYEKQRAFLTEQAGKLTLADVRRIAGTFGTWRETNYIPVAAEARDLLVIHQERAAIETAKARWEKIKSDVEKLRAARVRGTEALPELLAEAGRFIESAESFNGRAYQHFWSQFPLLMLTGETVTSTESTATTSQTNTEYATTASNAETRGMQDASSTLQSEPQPTMSIKDLVRESLTNVRSAYQIFIEMSNLVRKLFS